MKFKTVTVKTDHASSELVSSAMFDAGAEGVSILDKEDFNDLIKSDVIWDYVDDSATAADDTVSVTTQIAEENAEEYAKRLKEQLDAMAENGGVSYTDISLTDAPETDWVSEWKKYYRPVKTKYITIVPTWWDYSPEEGERVIRLDPGAAFGTGGHATTKMCLNLMDVEGKSVIDVGCGSGILGIAAKLAGASDVYMCDIDPQAVQFAKKNAEDNGVDAVIEEADLIAGDRSADFVFANLTADILMRLAGALASHINEGGCAVLSGIIDERLDEVEKCFAEHGFRIVTRVKLDEWRALKIVKR